MKLPLDNSHLPEIPDNWGQTDLLSDEFAELYFKTEEHSIYYQSLKKVGQKRDFSNKLTSTLQSMYNYIHNTATNKTIEMLLKAQSNTHASSSITQFNEFAKSIYPEGYALLDIKENLTIDYLKNCYRKSSMIHHPDRGGKTLNMQVLNEAYTIFHKFILEHEFVDDLQQQEISINSHNYANTKEYFGAIGQILINSYTDIWAVDKAYQIIEEYCEENYSINEIGKSLIGYGVNVWESMILRLKLANMNEQAEHTFSILEKYCMLASKSEAAYLKKIPSIVRRKLDLNRNTSSFINHYEQASNAYRLGIIGDQLYSSFLKARIRCEKENAIIVSTIQEYADKMGFISDLGIYEAQEYDKPGGLVPEPPYFTNRFKHLTELQRADYLNAFKGEIDLDTIKKYLWFRLNSYFVAMILSYEKLDHEAIINECKLLEKVFPNESGKLNIIYELYEYLRNLNIDDRTKKLGILRDLDIEDNVFKPHTFILSNIEPSKPHKCIELREDYLDFVKWPIEKLHLFINEGSDDGNASGAF